MRDGEQGVSTVRRLINDGPEGSSSPGAEETESEPVGDWEGTLELAEAVTVPPLSVRIAWCRVVRRNASTVVKVPRNQEVLVDSEGLPGVLVAWRVATLDGIMSSMNAGGSPPFMVNMVKSPLVVSVFSPRDKFVASSDGVASSNGSTLVLEQDSSSGECLPELPEGGLTVATTCRRDNLQAESSSLPVENRFGTQVDTTYRKNTAQVNKTVARGQIIRNMLIEPTICETSCPSPPEGASPVLLYCNVISPQFLGDSTVRCIRTFRLYPKIMGQHEFRNVKYGPVEQCRFQDIRIEFLKTEGLHIPFEDSTMPTKVVLHFRKNYQW